MKRLFSDGGSSLRAVIRAIIVCGTAFGLQLDTDQVAGIYMLTEATLQLGEQVTKGKAE